MAGSAFSLTPVLAFAADHIRSILRPGDVVVDATVGNGYDTLLLAEGVGATGKVFGFDVQEQALKAARHRLEAANVADRVTLMQAGHETLGTVLRQNGVAGIRAATFNLGYLPGGDKKIVTQGQTTCTALEAALELLWPGGRLSVVLYTGHPGGSEEATIVETWVREHDPDQVQIVRYAFLNRRTPPPYALILEKRSA